MPISCIIIDDEPNALHLLEEYIGKIPSLRLKGKFFDALESLEFLRTEQVDLIFTDINMPGLSGLELAEVLPPKQKIIFTTAFAEHALASFRYHVIDYLLKPISLRRFIQTVNKAESMMVPKDSTSESPQSRDLAFVKSGRQIVRVDFRDTLYIKGEREYIGIYSRTDRVLVYKRLKDVESLLPDYFIRIHLSYIVNTRHVLKFESNHVFVGEVHLPLGDTYRDAFMNFLNLNLNLDRNS
jgi:DNA-binding LytR/AlgR family response regulator